MLNWFSNSETGRRLPKSDSLPVRSPHRSVGRSVRSSDVPAGGAALAKRMLSTTTSNRRKWASPRRHSPFVRFRPGKVQSQSTHRRRLGLGVSLEKRGLFFVTRLIRRRRLPPFIKGCSFVRSSPCRLVVIECPELWRHRRDALPRATGQPSPSGPGGEIFHCNERGRTDRAGER